MAALQLMLYWQCGSHDTLQFAGISLQARLLKLGQVLYALWVMVHLAFAGQQYRQVRVTVVMLVVFFS